MKWLLGFEAPSFPVGNNRKIQCVTLNGVPPVLQTPARVILYDVKIQGFDQICHQLFGRLVNHPRLQQTWASTADFRSIRGGLYVPHSKKNRNGKLGLSKRRLKKDQGGWRLSWVQPGMLPQMPLCSMSDNIVECLLQTLGKRSNPYPVQLQTHALCGTLMP